MNKNNETHIKNLKAYKSVRRIIIGGITMFTATAIAAGTIIAYQFKTKKDLNTNIQSIISYYGEDSDEAKVINYLELAIELNNLELPIKLSNSKLDDYKYSNELMQSLNLSNELADPEEIDSMIKKFKNFGDLNVTSELEEIYDFLKTIVYLKNQKELIKNYVNNKGYNIVSQRINSSLKEYAAEEYNLNEKDNIYFGYIFDKADGEEVVTISCKESYHSSMCIVDNKKLKNGVCEKTGFERTNYKEISDDERLNKYVSALLQAKNLKTEVDLENVYNQKSENKLKR